MNEQDDIVEFMLETGALKKVGTDKDTGEDLYELTEKADEFFPEFTESFFTEINNAVFFLWQRDFLELYFDDDGEPLIGPADKAYDKTSWKELDIEDAFILKQIVAIFDESDDPDEWYNDEEGDDF